MSKLNKCVLSHLSYNKDTGLIFNSNTGRYYDNATHSKGYIQIGLRDVNDNKFTVLGHRLAWYLHYGYEAEQIDHINHVKSDNRIDNLQEVTNKLNMQNRLKQKGSNTYANSYQTATGIYLSSVVSVVTHRQRSLGKYKKAEDAHLVSVYYKSINYDNYQGADLPDTLNGIPHPFKDGTLKEVVKNIVDTNNRPAMIQIENK